MIYNYNKSQPDALFLKFTFDKELYMFRTDLLSIIRSLSTVYTTTGICHLSILTLLADSQHNCMRNTSCCEYSIQTPDDGQ